MHREKLIKSVSKENFGQRYSQYIFQYDVFQNNNSILLFILSSTPPPPHTKRLRKYTHKHFFACIICKLENYLSKKTHFSHMLMCIKKTLFVTCTGTLMYTHVQCIHQSYICMGIKSTVTVSQWQFGVGNFVTFRVSLYIKNFEITSNEIPRYSLMSLNKNAYTVLVSICFGRHAFTCLYSINFLWDCGCFVNVIFKLFFFHCLSLKNMKQ